MDNQALVTSMPFAAGLGIRLDAAAADEVRGRMDWDATAARSAARSTVVRS